MEPKEGQNAIGDIEEFFPTNRIEIINQNIANNDARTIHDKMEKYEELDSDQRYPYFHSDDKLFATYPYF